MWKKLRSKSGMTLTELLAAVLLLGLIVMVLGGGVVMVKNVYQRTQEKANAEQALAVTAQLMTDEFANALEVKTSSGDSDLMNPVFRSGNNHLWMKFGVSSDGTTVSGTGIEKWYGDNDTDGYMDSKTALLTSASIPDGYCTSFESYSFSKDTSCFTIKKLAVYRKKDMLGTSQTPAVEPIDLVVRAVNLSGGK